MLPPTLAIQVEENNGNCIDASSLEGLSAVCLSCGHQEAAPVVTTSSREDPKVKAKRGGLTFGGDNDNASPPPAPAPVPIPAPRVAVEPDELTGKKVSILGRGVGTVLGVEVGDIEAGGRRRHSLKMTNGDEELIALKCGDNEEKGMGEFFHLLPDVSGEETQ